MFKDFCGDTTKEIKRLKMILDSVAEVPPPTPEKAVPIVTDIAKAISSLEFEEEEW